MLTLAESITPETTINLTVTQMLLMVGALVTFAYYGTTVLLMLRSHQRWIRQHDEKYGPMTHDAHKRVA